MELKLKNLREGEVLVIAVRRHWIIYIFLGLLSLGALIFSLSLFIALGWGFAGVISNVVFWLMFSIFLYIQWLNHELDLFLVTNNRIIGVDQISFLNRTVTECILSQVQEVNSQTKGILANLLNYGNLVIQTAGSQSNLTMSYAPDTMQEARKIHNIVDIYRDNQVKK